MSFRPTQSLAASVFVFTSLFSVSPPPPRLSRSFRPTRSLATSSLFLASALPLFHLVSPKPEPSRSFRPTRFLAASFLVSPSPCLLCHHFPTSSPPLGLSGSFRPTGTFSNLLSLPCFPFLPLLPKPEPSRSFRPTRFLLPPTVLFNFPGTPCYPTTQSHSGPLGYWLHLGTLRGAAVRERCAGDVQV